MNQNLKAFISYGLAILIPVLLYAFAFLNEKDVVLTILVPLITFTVAGYVTGGGNPKWVGWSALLGAALGVIAIITI